MKIIRSHNTPNKVTLVDGTIIERDKSGKIWIAEYGTFVPWAGYDNHFIFEVPERIQGTSYLCSCGSPAVIVGPCLCVCTILRIINMQTVANER
jgi:hypothetical protein